MVDKYKMADYSNSFNIFPAPYGPQDQLQQNDFEEIDTTIFSKICAGHALLTATLHYAIRADMLTELKNAEIQCFGRLFLRRHWLLGQRDGSSFFGRPISRMI